MFYNVHIYRLNYIFILAHTFQRHLKCNLSKTNLNLFSQKWFFLNVPHQIVISFSHCLLNCHIQSIIRFSLTFPLAMLPKGTSGPGRELYWNNTSSYLSVPLPTGLRGEEMSCLLSEFRRRGWLFCISLFGCLSCNSKCILKHIETNLTKKNARCAH